MTLLNINEKSLSILIKTEASKVNIDCVISQILKIYLVNHVNKDARTPSVNLRQSASFVTSDCFKGICLILWLSFHPSLMQNTTKKNEK